MIEQIILDYLAGKLSVSVRMEEEPDLPGSYVLVEKTGGGETNYIKRATVAIQSYAGSLYEAARLNEEVKDAMSGIAELDTVSKCSLNSDYNYTDTFRKKYRYQAVYDIVHY